MTFIGPGVFAYPSYTILQFDFQVLASPLVRVSLTDGMIAAHFLRDPTGIRIGHALPNGPTAGSCGPFLFGCNSAQAARHLHGSTKVAGEGRLWMMRCAPLISIVAQSVCMAVILPPEMAARSGEGRL